MTSGPSDARGIDRLLITCMTIGFLALALAGAAAAWTTMRAQEHGRWVVHTYAVEVQVGRVITMAERAETARRGYLLGGGDRFLAVYRDSLKATDGEVDRLARMTADNPDQQARIARYRRDLAELGVQQRQTVDTAMHGNLPAAAAKFRADSDSTRPMTHLRAEADAMRAAERTLLARRDARERASVQAFYFLLLCAGVLVVITGVLSLATVLRYTRSLNASRRRLQVLNDSLEEQVASRTGDLVRANEEIQRFAYIVSHDLRSPLVNVMGFTAELESGNHDLATFVGRVEAEAPALADPAAARAAREDLPEAIGFIRSSTQKMDRLINAILKLSREGRRVLTPETVDLGALADSVAGSVKHLADDRGATIAVARPLPSIVTDRLALEQILSNLVENAVKYLAPGRPGLIEISARAEPARILIAVNDNGRGIDAADHQRVFDLFRRSGAQDQPGEGIGLAHVQALAYRLGGVVTVVSTLGEGSTFTLSLPLTLSETRESVR